jgi:citrate lyase beta subunit
MVGPAYLPLDARESFADCDSVPSSSQRMLDKSRSLRVDCVAYDLEDSVTPSRKAEARRGLRAFLGQPRPKSIREQSVRINSVSSGYALDDLTEIVSRVRELRPATLSLTRSGRS